MQILLRTNLCGDPFAFVQKNDSFDARHPPCVARILIGRRRLETLDEFSRWRRKHSIASA
jgi:hypothetical protein